MKKLITIFTACYNEEDNIEALSRTVKDIFNKLPQYEYEHLFIDNASTDKTVERLRKMAAEDRHIRVIVNAKNYGHIRSPFHGMLQARGDALISIVADFQDPPELIQQFLEKWEEGHPIVVGIKVSSHENRVMKFLRKKYYQVISKISDTKMIPNYTGFGLYDKSIIEILRKIEDPYPYFRGLIAEIGFDIAEIPYEQPPRKSGETKNNLYTLLDMALLGVTSHSILPIRLLTIVGFTLSFFGFLLSIVYLVMKLLFWNRFSFGLAPMLIGFFFFASIQLFFLGLIGEYIFSILRYVRKRPLVIERERINFK